MSDLDENGYRTQASRINEKEPPMAEVVANTGLLSDTTLHVEDTGGTGRPVVLIHGWPLTGESWKA